MDDPSKSGTQVMISFGSLNRETASMVLAATLTFEAVGMAVIVAAGRPGQRADAARRSVFRKAGNAWKICTS
jgi:hypothetical protein